MSDLNWGWRVTCHHDGCSEVLERWSPTGTPGLDTRFRKDWFWTSFGMKDEHGEYVVENYCRVYYHVAYCPEHAGPAKDYEKAKSAWHQARYEVGKKKATGIMGLLETLGRKLFNFQVGQTVAEWEQENPRPEPPWSLPWPT